MLLFPKSEFLDLNLHHGPLWLYVECRKVLENTYLLSQNEILHPFVT